MKIKRIVEVFILLLILVSCTDNLYVKSGMYTPDLTIDTSDAINTGEDATFNLSEISSRKGNKTKINISFNEAEDTRKNRTILKSLDEDEIERLIETLHFLKKNCKLTSFLNAPCSEEMAQKAKDTAIFYSAVLKANLDGLNQMIQLLVKELGGEVNSEAEGFLGDISESLKNYQETAETRQWTNGDFIFAQTITNLFGGVVDIMQPIGYILGDAGAIALENLTTSINNHKTELTDAIKNKEAGTLTSILVDNLAFVDSVGSITDGSLGLPTIGDIIGSLI